MAIQDTSAGAGAAPTRPLDGEDASDLKLTLENSARGLTSELKREGQRLMHDAGESAVTLANEKKSVAADYLRAVAEAADASREVLEQRGYAGTSRFLTSAVNGLSSFTDDLATREPAELLDDAVQYARRNPALFLGAALFAGFGLARVLKVPAVADDEEEVDEAHPDDGFADAPQHEADADARTMETTDAP